MQEPQITTSEELTGRQRQVLELLVLGDSNREIAEKMFVCEDTVKYHLKHIYEKLGARRRTQAVRMARQGGLLAVSAKPTMTDYE